ncbi:SdpI family protein [Peptoniphilus obesi]|uniref:SdpI family protein n=1 Tax=Peptoniphilus obesi TaxID=1472765 RepID=UPI0004B78D84|nr:SdpI family protein [Peptoniphilus obesi]
MKRKTAFKLGLLIFLFVFAVCLIFYKRLPSELPIHFNMNNQADSFASKEMALFGVNGFMLVLYLFCYFITNKDPKVENQGDKALNVVLIFVPILAILTSAITISYGLNYRPRIDLYLNLALSIMFILIGNYLPKTKRNYTLGIKLPWTLASDYVWEKTHRLAGYLWVIGGLVSLIGTILFKEYNSYIFVGAIIIMVFIPMLYSYLVYEKIKKQADEDND